MTMLPENLFIGLIDTDLQRQIANCETRDKDTTEALTLLIGKDQIILDNELNNWEVQKFEGKSILFFKGKTTSLKTKNCAETLRKCSMTEKPPDTPEK
jgi:broad specificity phosphatase PhoE